MLAIKELRKKLNYTQKEFSEKYRIPLSTLRKWEQGESRTPSYIIFAIEKSLPFNYENCEEIIENNVKYYLNREHKKVFDSQGNSITFNETINDISKNNLFKYINNLFYEYYKIVEEFDENLLLDKKEKIEWK